MAVNTDFQPNSHKFKEEQSKAVPARTTERRATKVVTGSAKTKKKSELSKFKNSMISEDAASVKSYIFSDVLIPAAKKLLDDIICDGMHMILYGDTGRGGRRSTVDRVSYDRYSRRDTPRRDSRDRRNSVLEYDDISFESRGDAEKVLHGMDEIMLEYGLVRVADMFDLAGLTCDYPAMDYGWTNINNAEIVRVRGEYVIKMPRAIPIK